MRFAIASLLAASLIFCPCTAFAEGTEDAAVQDQVQAIELSDADAVDENDELEEAVEELPAADSADVAEESPAEDALESEPIEAAPGVENDPASVTEDHRQEPLLEQDAVAEPAPTPKVEAEQEPEPAVEATPVVEAVPVAASAAELAPAPAQVPAAEPAAALAPQALDAEAEGLAEGIYVIRSMNASRQVLDVTAQSKSAGANVETWDSNGGGNQKWEVRRAADGTYTLKSVLSGLLLDVSGAAARNGANVIQWQANGGSNQRWSISSAANGSWSIASALSKNLVLDVSGASKSSGANVIVWAPNGGANQLWEFVPANPNVAAGESVDAGWYRIKANGASLDVSGISGKSGANVGLWDQNLGPNQVFFISTENGFATIATGTGGAVSAAGADPIAGSNVSQQAKSTSDSQRFSIEKSQNGYAFKNVSNGLYLAAASASKQANIVSSSKPTLFELEPVSSFIEEGMYAISASNASSLSIGAVGAAQKAGTAVEQNTALSHLHQKWVLEEVDGAANTYSIRAANSGLALSAKGDAVSLAAMGPSDRNQQWRVKPAAGGWVFENAATSKVLDVSGNTANRGAKLCAWSSNGGANQRFLISAAQPLENGTVVSFALANAQNQVVDVNDASKLDNAPVTTWAYNGGSNQQWRVEQLSNGLFTLTNIASGKLLSLASNGTVTQLGRSSSAQQQWDISFDIDTGSFTLSSQGLNLCVSGASDGSKLSAAGQNAAPAAFRLIENGFGQPLDVASSAQKRIASIAWSEPTTPAGWCAMWVHNIFARYGWNDIYGNACDLYDNYCTSSDYSALKVGMIVAVSRHPNTSGGRQYGHIGIYVGDGVLLDSSGSVRTWHVKDWVSSYNGWVPARWGWYGNRSLA